MQKATAVVAFCISYIGGLVLHKFSGHHIFAILQADDIHTFCQV